MSRNRDVFIHLTDYEGKRYTYHRVDTSSKPFQIRLIVTGSDWDGLGHLTVIESKDRRLAAHGFVTPQRTCDGQDDSFASLLKRLKSRDPIHTNYYT